MAENRLFQLQEALEGTSAKIEEERMTKSCYFHMLDRMKKDYIATKIESAELENSLRSKVQILELEQLKQRRTKEEKLQSKAIFDNLLKNIEKEQKDR